MAANDRKRAMRNGQYWVFKLHWNLQAHAHVFPSVFQLKLLRARAFQPCFFSLPSVGTRRYPRESGDRLLRKYFTAQIRNREQQQFVIKRKYLFDISFQWQHIIKGLLLLVNHNNLRDGILARKIGWAWMMSYERKKFTSLSISH